MKLQLPTFIPFRSFLMIVLLLAGCTESRWVTVPNSASTNKTGQSFESSGFPVTDRLSTAIAPGYLIGLRSSDPKVKGEFRVEFDGTLKLPYNVKLTAADLSESQLRDEIRNAYRTYFRSPNDINVTVLQKEYLVDAQGLVQKPGRYVLKEDGTLDELIAQAGGLQDSSSAEGKAKYAFISTATGTHGLIKLADYHSGKQQKAHWLGGESVFFQSDAQGGAKGNTAVTVLGQVKSPSQYVAEETGDFYTYLIKAGGPTDRADLGNITVIRPNGNTTSALSFDAQSPASIPQILPGDTIIVNADNPSQLEKKSRVWANFANIISALGIIVVAAH